MEKVVFLQNESDDRESRIEPTTETPRQILAMLLASIKAGKAEGNVETLVNRARALLPEAGLTCGKRVTMRQQLDAFLLEGYEAEAWKQLEEARRWSKITDISCSIDKMCAMLTKVGLQATDWLAENGSSWEEMEELLKEGARSKELTLAERRERSLGISQLLPRK
jgi:hypothetical protein